MTLDGATRPDRRSLIEGRGAFLDDIEIPDILTCHFVRSVLPHATILSLNIREATSSAGVRAVFTADDLGLKMIPGNLRHGPPAPHMARPPLATERVRYVGEPLAMIVADSAAHAADAADLVIPDLEPLASVVDPVQAARDECLLFEMAGTNVVDQTTTVEASSTRYPVHVGLQVANQRVAPLALEPIGMIAQPRGEELHIWCGHQAPHRLRSQLASMLDVEEHRIRVIVPNVGGGFGAKAMLYPEYLVVAAVALKLRTALRWTATRREDLTGGIHGRGHLHQIELEGESDGRIRRARVEIVADLGAYPHNGSMVPSFTSFMSTGPYMIEEIITTTTMVVTNTAPIGTYRGAGRPEATYALERAIDAFADATGLSPAEVRRINLIPGDRLPRTSPSGAVYDSGDYTELLDLTLKLADIDSIRREQVRRIDAGEPLLGVGLSFYLERAGGPLAEGEHASVAIDPTGSLSVRVGAVDTGQGHDRLWRRIASRPFDLDPDHVVIVSGDTALVPDGVGTFASRSTQLCGSVVRRTTAEVFQIARAVAARKLEVAPEDLIARHGGFEVMDEPETRIELSEVVSCATEDGTSLRSQETWVPGAHTFPYGAHVAVVEVDPETGDVRLIRALAVDDCGNLIDMPGVIGQVHGSLAQGIGQARFEHFRYSGSGQPLTTTLVDYLAPRATDLPLFEWAHLTHPAPSNPLGAKGVGESGCIGFPPAMVSAVLDAVRHLGIESIEMPVDPGAVWSAINQASRRSLQGARD